MRQHSMTLVVATGLALLGESAAAPSAMAVQELWEGNWNATTGVVLHLKQNGTEVFGTYTGNGGGRVDGTTSADGQTLKGTYQGHPNGGVFAIKLGADQVTFAGTYAQCKWRIWGHYLRCPDPKRWSGEKF